VVTPLIVGEVAVAIGDRQKVPAWQMSAAWTGVAPELILSGEPRVLRERLTPRSTSPTQALVSLKSSDFEPYHVIAIRPGSPA